jgi:hypothetical protein
VLIKEVTLKDDLSDFQDARSAFCYSHVRVEVNSNENSTFADMGLRQQRIGSVAEVRAGHTWRGIRIPDYTALKLRQPSTHDACCSFKRVDFHEEDHIPTREAMQIAEAAWSTRKQDLPTLFGVNGSKIAKGGYYC